MLGREDEFEAASRLFGEPGPGLLGDVREMVVDSFVESA